jgi:formate hydrogenlyase subunit 4
VRERRAHAIAAVMGTDEWTVRAPVLAVPGVTILLAILAQLLHMVLVLAAAPTVLGMTRWIALRLVGRSGAPMLQPWHDMLRLSRKQVVLPENASRVSDLAPIAAFVLTLTCAWLVPSFVLGMATAPMADLLTVAGLLLLARVIPALAAMDVGSAIGGLGASQRMQLGCFLEPGLLLVIFTLAVLAGSDNLDQIAGLQNEGMLLPGAASTLAAAALVAIALADMAALPAPLDREFGGLPLALLQATEAVRLLVWLDLIGALFLPIGLTDLTAGPLSWLFGLLAWGVKLLLFAVAIAGLRASIGSAAFRRMPDLVGLAVLLGVIAGVLALVNVATP